MLCSAKFSLSARDGDSNRLHLAGKNPNHTPVLPPSGSCWVTFYSVRETLGPNHAAHSGGGRMLGSSGYACPSSIPIPPHILPTSSVPIYRFRFPARTQWLGFTVGTIYLAVMWKVRSISVIRTATVRSLIDTDGININHNHHPNHQILPGLQFH